MLTERLQLFFNSLGVDWVMYILIALSVLSLTVILEKWFILRRENRERRRFLDGIRDLNSTLANPSCIEAK
ncbi:MAG: hypothetical protein FJ088_02080, partial [Deltaproteobacteria bacterium]|nr:hypothetical protein [Deltaproteobacteria bacterium]